MELSARQRAARMTAALAVLLALIAGTLWGNDEHFPFGPFRMYSTRNDPNGTISVTKVRATSTDGRELRIPLADFGLRRAELDGQIWRFADDSRLAGILVEAYENMGSRPPLMELEITRTYFQLRNGRPVSSFERTLGSWRKGS
jgi:hypothetical protein